MTATHTVVTSFSTPTRRFSPGQTVGPADITGPLSFEDRIRIGQIAAPTPEPTPEPAAEPETDPKPAKPGKGKAVTEPDPAA
ncbi:hypothetical protein J2847_002962 [Azospirillum agricola]|uniref:hypothetical protein n=1 Tax=Azospirillum agricola TaxID=1720247 RepID=UPI001AE8C66D|nr:hypothetical protein [Azospirillum agricola]MBP2229663.1 hypothetical protein [Azospirillum agricola]